MKFKNLKSSSGEVISAFTYERSAAGYPTKITREDGYRIDYGYDDAHQVTHEKMSSPQATVYQHDYDYDNVGSRSEKKYENDTGKKVLYDYNDDGMNLLWTANGTQGSKANVTGKFTEDNVIIVSLDYPKP